MVFNNKGGFFLDLGSEGAKPAQVALAAAPAQPAKQPAAAAAAPVTTAAPAAAAPAASGGPVLTTAEAIAAELRATQEAKPPASVVTFAPEALNPANAVPTRRRKAGANLAGYKQMAAGMFRS
jgi:hypothetical protein